MGSQVGIGKGSKTPVSDPGCETHPEPYDNPIFVCTDQLHMATSCTIEPRQVGMENRRADCESAFHADSALGGPAIGSEGEEDIDVANTGTIPRWISQAQMAELLSVSRWTVRRARLAGRLRYVEVVPGLIRFDVRQVDELVKPEVSRNV